MIIHPNIPVFSALFKQGILPVLPQADMLSQKRLLDLFAETGIRVVEYRDAITGRKSDSFHELAAHVSQYAGFYIGVNTIQKKIADELVQGGASFVTSSFMKEEMADLTKRNNIPWIPGCSSPVDVERAHQLGAAAISLLPATWVPSDISPLSERFPGLHLIPSTGIVMNNSSMKAWIRAGALCIRVGKGVLSPQDITIKDWDKIKRNILSVFSMIKMARPEEKASLSGF